MCFRVQTRLKYFYLLEDSKLGTHKLSRLKQLFRNFAKLNRKSTTSCCTEYVISTIRRLGDVMKQLFFFLGVMLVLSSCGTVQGVMNGAGEVLNGMAVDARSLGGLFN